MIGTWSMPLKVRIFKFEILDNSLTIGSHSFSASSGARILEWLEQGVCHSRYGTMVIYQVLWRMYFLLGFSNKSLVSLRVFWGFLLYHSLLPSSSLSAFTNEGEGVTVVLERSSRFIMELVSQYER
jgi:hypothetical protein